MRNRQRRFRPGTSRISAPAALFLLVALALPARAASPVPVDTLIGFNGIAHEGSNAPVIVSIQNAGPRRSFDVRLEVLGGTSFRGNLSARSMSLTADLAASATRRIPFVVPFPPDARTMIVSVSVAGALVSRQELDLRPFLSPDRIVAAISSELLLDGLAALSDQTGSVRVVYPRIDDLPDAWAGYEGVQTVVVHDTYFRELRSSQVDALERWVAAGGSLVFTGGSAALQHAPAGFARLLPVRVTGTAEREGLPSLAGSEGGLRGRVTLATTELVRGTIIVSEGSLPLVVRRDLGEGHVWFFAFDPTLPPVASWHGLLNLWREVAAGQRSPPSAGAALSLLNDPWMKPLLAERSFPSPLSAATFAVVYAGLILLLVIGKAARRMSPAARLVLFVAIPVAGGLGAGIAFEGVAFPSGPQSLDASRLWMRSGDGLAVVTEKTGVITASAGTASFSAGNLDCTVELRSKSRTIGAMRPVTLATSAGDGGTTGTLALDRFGGELLVFTGVIPCAVTLTVSGGREAPRVVVTNGTASALRDCVLWRDGMAFSLGDIAAGTNVTRDTAPSPGGNPATPARAAVFETETAGREASAGFLVAWMDGSPLRVSVAGSARRVDRAPVTVLLVEAAE